MTKMCYVRTYFSIQVKDVKDTNNEVIHNLFQDIISSNSNMNHNDAHILSKNR